MPCRARNACTAAARRCATGSGSPPVTAPKGALDMLICNAVVIDPVLGIVKGDIGIKDGRIVGIGKAGNPAIMDGVIPI
jgi:urease subunit alpha